MYQVLHTLYFSRWCPVLFLFVGTCEKTVLATSLVVCYIANEVVE